MLDEIRAGTISDPDKIGRCQLAALAAWLAGRAFDADWTADDTIREAIYRLHAIHGVKIVERWAPGGQDAR